MINNIMTFIFELSKWAFKVHIQTYLILIIVFGTVTPFYTFFTHKVDMNLKDLIIIQEKNKIKEKEILSQCTSKTIVVINDFKKAIANKNKDIHNNKDSLSKYTNKECKDFYEKHIINSEIKSNYYKHFLPYLIILYILLKLITKRWI